MRSPRLLTGDTRALERAPSEYATSGAFRPALMATVGRRKAHQVGQPPAEVRGLPRWSQPASKRKKTMYTAWIAQQKTSYV
jgi:hypothetical protein